MSYYNKYLKYKNKYLELSKNNKLYGGSNNGKKWTCEICGKTNYGDNCNTKNCDGSPPSLRPVESKCDKCKNSYWGSSCVCQNKPSESNSSSASNASNKVSAIGSSIVQPQRNSNSSSRIESLNNSQYPPLPHWYKEPPL